METQHATAGTHLKYFVMMQKIIRFTYITHKANKRDKEQPHWDGHRQLGYENKNRKVQL